MCKIKCQKCAKSKVTMHFVIFNKLDTTEEDFANFALNYVQRYCTSHSALLVCITRVKVSLLQTVQVKLSLEVYSDLKAHLGMLSIKLFLFCL